MSQHFADDPEKLGQHRRRALSSPCDPGLQDAKYYGLQLTLRHVMFHDDRWRVLLIPPDGSPVHVTVPDSRPQDVRAALISALEVEG
jgi:hypothetical protein